ncbi:LysR family transcriptional regulator, partial [Pseudomonas syringae group genomosp. 7]|uniref:hypothetical protein n=1 Tax=Pseudomonas syringae group genomosp. 7 TaxID=251699 RepID=UPI00376FDDAA
TREGLALYEQIIKTYDGLLKIGFAAAEKKQGLFEKITIVSLPILEQTLLTGSFSKFLLDYHEFKICLTTHNSTELE